LRKGGTFNIRSLDDHKEYTINLDQQNDILMFSAIDQIEDNKYYQSESRTFPSIDAIIAPNILFQMTITMTHPIKMIGLKKLKDCKKLVKKGDINFYFVVPTQLYNNYPKQDFATTASGIAQMIPDWIKTHVQQYALKIDLTSENSSKSGYASGNPGSGSGNIGGSSRSGKAQKHTRRKNVK